MNVIITPGTPEPVILQFRPDEPVKNLTGIFPDVQTARQVETEWSWLMAPPEFSRAEIESIVAHEIRDYSHDDILMIYHMGFDWPEQLGLVHIEPPKPQANPMKAIKTAAAAVLLLAAPVSNANISGSYSCQSTLTVTTRYDNEAPQKARVKTPFDLVLTSDHAAWISPTASELHYSGDWMNYRSHLLVVPSQTDLYNNTLTECQSKGNACSITRADATLQGHISGKRITGKATSRQEAVVDGHYLTTLKTGAYTCQRRNNITLNPGAFE